MNRVRQKIAVRFTRNEDQMRVSGLLTQWDYTVIDISGEDNLLDVDLFIFDRKTVKHLLPGLQVLKNASDIFLPVIVAQESLSDPGSCHFAGIDDCLSMPIVPEELKLRVEIMLRLRTQSEQLSRKSEYKWQTLFDYSPDAIFVHPFQSDGFGKFIEVNRVACVRYGYSRREFLELTPADISDAGDVARYGDKHARQLMLNAGNRIFTAMHITRSGTKFPVEISSTLMELDGKKLIISIARDMTRQHQVEKKLQLSEERYKNVFEHSGTAMILLDRKGSIIMANKMCEKEAGFTAQQLIGTPWWNYVAPPDLERMKKYFKTRFISPDHVPNRYETRLVDAQGQIRYCTINVNIIPSTKQVLVSMLDITTRIQAEEKRRLLAHAIENIEECVFISDEKNRITYVNKNFEKITGYSFKEVRGKTPGILKSWMHEPDFYIRLKSHILSGRSWKGTMINRRKDGSLYEVSASISPMKESNGRVTHFVSVHRDITREREIARRMEQNQRLEAVGTLAGGIAHDFNNLLTPILGYVELSRELTPPGDEIRENLDHIHAAALRAKDLIRQILSFSRQSSHKRAFIDIVPIVKEALKLLRATIPSSIEIVQKIDVRDWMVKIDATEIHQIVMNLCTNARDAISDVGTITVSLAAIEIGTGSGVGLPELKPGIYLKLTVQDTGCGIDPAIRNKIFEPYFSTKSEFHGTGLGLSILHGIVTGIGGAVTADSIPGQGAEFNVFLPAVKHVDSSREQPLSAPKGNREKIMYVDDEPAIAALGKRYLEFLGYSVSEFTDPVKALAVFRSDPTRFDLIVTDMTMPGMTGDTLARELLKLRPDIPVILCTGFSEKIKPASAAELGITTFFYKPVDMKKLATVVHDILST